MQERRFPLTMNEQTQLEFSVAKVERKRFNAALSYALHRCLDRVDHSVEDWANRNRMGFSLSVGCDGDL